MFWNQPCFFTTLIDNLFFSSVPIWMFYILVVLFVVSLFMNLALLRGQRFLSLGRGLSRLFSSIVVVLFTTSFLTCMVYIYGDAREQRLREAYHRMSYEEEMEINRITMDMWDYKSEKGKYPDSFTAFLDWRASKDMKPFLNLYTGEPIKGTDFKEQTPGEYIYFRMDMQTPAWPREYWILFYPKPARSPYPWYYSLRYDTVYRLSRALLYFSLQYNGINLPTSTPHGALTIGDPVIYSEEGYIHGYEW